MIHPPRLFHALLLALVWTTAARAADPGVATFRAVCFDPREAEPPAFYIPSTAVARKVLDVDKSRISDTQKVLVRDGRYVDFYLTASPKDGEVPAMTLTLPEGTAEQLLFLLLPAATGYRATAIKLPPADFKPGSTLMLNASPAEIAVVLAGAKPLVVKSGSNEFLKIPDGFKDAMIPIQIYEKGQGEGQWEIAQSTRWAVDLRFRSYVFFYHSPQTNHLMLHGVTERTDTTGGKE